MIRSYRFRRILAPTAGLMRAVGLLALGFVVFFIGVGLSFRRLIVPVLVGASGVVRSGVQHLVSTNQVEVTSHWMGLFCLIGGVLLCYRGVRAGLIHIVETLNPDLKSGKVDVYVRRQQLAQGPRIVAIGGGTGLSTLLRGLKHYSSNITAIVCVTDDGGSSGRLVREMNMIPPGDIRNCLVALADAEGSMTDLFQHRFRSDAGTLSGHSMGNLLIAALVAQAHGDFEKAVEIASDVLAIRGRVVPATLERVRLRGILDSGQEITGETAIVEAHGRIRKMMLDPENCTAAKEAIDAIRAADLIVMGPGSVFTSIIPNLLVPEIAEAIDESSAIKVYVCNVMTQPGESDSFTASEHVGAILQNVNRRLFDMVLVNNGVPSEDMMQRYMGSGQTLVEADIDRIRAMGFRVLAGNYMNESDVVRHDPMRVAARLMRLLGL